MTRRGQAPVNSRKRRIAVDTFGLLLAVIVTMAGIQDRDAGLRLLGALRARFSTISLIWADAGYAGQLVTRTGDTESNKRSTRPGLRWSRW